MLFNKHHFPIGSVVGLENDSRRLFILGRQLYSESNHIIRDYAALEYPNGFIDAKEKFILFDKDDVMIVYHYGYVDDKEMKLDELLHQAEQTSSDKENDK